MAEFRCECIEWVLFFPLHFGLIHFLLVHRVDIDVEKNRERGKECESKVKNGEIKLGTHKIQNIQVVR